MSQVINLNVLRDRLTSGERDKAWEEVNSMPIYATSMILRAEVLLVEGEYAEADRAVRAALKLCPNSPRALLLLESIGARAVDREATLGDLFDDEESIRIDPPVPNVDADTEEKPRPSPEPADTVEDESTADTPGLVSETLARLLIKQQKFAEAKKVYIQLSRLHPDRYDYFRRRMDELIPKSSGK